MNDTNLMPSPAAVPKAMTRSRRCKYPVQHGVRATLFLFWMCGLLLLHLPFSTIAREETKLPNECTVENGEETCNADATSSSSTSQEAELLRARGLEPMTVDIGHGEETFWTYTTPDVSSFYQQAPGTMKAQHMTFNGLTGKFVNLSPQKLRLFWDPNDGRDGVYIGDAAPFGPTGTATYPTHAFYFTPFNDPNQRLNQFVVSSKTSVYVYDPVADGTADLSSWTPAERDLYQLQTENLKFAQQYKQKTGRDWLALYGRRERPLHKMWDATHFGQTHYVNTNQTHFHTIPPADKLKETNSQSGGCTRRLGPDEPRILSEYRNEEVLSLKMTVISCAPRAFEILDFLSEAEVDHILELATKMDLRESLTGAAGDTGTAKVENTRTSRNTWITRSMSPIVDSIYRRAADLLEMDEALFRSRLKSKDDSDQNATDLIGSKLNIAEDLQLVHYDVSQQYTPHHDFSFPATQGRQKARFATLLLYLNDDLKGGETSFPRWKNVGSSKPLLVKPQKGKAVLFYSILPDGNYDDLSQHAAQPVLDGEKWLTNLWIWDPVK